MMPTGAPANMKQPFVGVEAVGFAAGAEGAVGGGDAAREVDRHRERRFGHRLREGRGRAQHMDAARLAVFVVDVGQEVGFDVEDRLQLRRAVDALLRHRGLADQDRRVRQQAVHHLVRHLLVFGDDQAAKRLQAPAHVRFADDIQGPRQRIDENERPIGHERPFLPSRSLYRSVPNEAGLYR